MEPRHPLVDTHKQILREQLPNFLRLYLNPYVTQTCYCLSRYMQLWHGQPGAEYQTFLANGFDEALGGAIKLARYCASVAGRPTTGLILDPADRLGPFAGTAVFGDQRVQFLPGLVVAGKNGDARAAAESGGPFGLVVLVAEAEGEGEGMPDRHAEACRLATLRDSPLVVACVDRQSLGALLRNASSILRHFAPDIVVFDESFVDRAVPFSAFTARKTLYDHWNRPGKTTFHSTTYQPNTVSSLHFMKSLATADPEFHASLAPDLQAIQVDLAMREDLFARLYSPSLSKVIRTTGFNTADVRAAGDFIYVNGRKIFDGVSGVACSVRGHNPVTYVEEIRAQGSLADCQAEFAARLRELTGLDHVLPAVSGATAVENALKVALVTQFPRRHVLALKAGFGGKTLLALTGTANPAYKEHIDPLYSDVLYVDPFASDAEAQIEAALEKHAVAVVQVELIQAVGGVRRVPEAVIRFLQACRQHHGYLLLVDEVQTGMYRTGPFTLSGSLELSPDLLVLGKGTSDMMFPFAVLLYSAGVQEKLDRAGAGETLPAAIRQRYGYEFGYRTALNVLRRAEELSLSRRVTEAGELFARLLGGGLSSCKAVREVRVYGLLIGIELDARRWPRRWLGKCLYSLYLYGMLRHRRYPVLVGFCQYEPNVLKITPALTALPEQIQEVCATIVDVLKRPLHHLLAAVLGGLLHLLIARRKKREHRHRPAHEPLAR
jgi:acetylornithine/succinyldiaminopimelate/putrescine aminotransferase